MEHRCLTAWQSFSIMCRQCCRTFTRSTSSSVKDNHSIAYQPKRITVGISQIIFTLGLADCKMSVFGGACMVANLVGQRSNNSVDIRQLSMEEAAELRRTGFFHWYSVDQFPRLSNWHASWVAAQFVTLLALLIMQHGNLAKSSRSSTNGGLGSFLLALLPSRSPLWGCYSCHSIA